MGRGEIWLRGTVLVHHEISLADLPEAVRRTSGGTVGAEAGMSVGRDGAGLTLGRDQAGMSIGRDGAAPAAGTPLPRSGLPMASRGRSRAAKDAFSPMVENASPLRILADDVSQVCADFVADLCQRFRAHLGGERVDYADVALDLGGRTFLQRALAEALREVRWGEVVTYGELAALAGRPGAARAAGAFCAECTWSLVVPCHRVVGASGLGGYGATGVAAKRRLLALEGVAL